MFWKKKPPPASIADSWAVYSYVYGEEQRAVIAFDAIAAREEEHSGHPHCVRAVVYVPLHRVLENGLPISSMLDPLQRIEEAFLKTLQKDGVNFRFVGKMTYGGMRDFVFQAEDAAAFKNSISKVTPSGGMRMELIEKPGWTFFDEKVKPAPVYWQQIADFQVIQGLIQAGSNPRKPHLLEHGFTGDPESLKYVMNALLMKGFAKVSCQDNRLVMGRESLLDLEQVFAATEMLFKLAPSVGVKYDGWGAEVTR